VKDLEDLITRIEFDVCSYLDFREMYPADLLDKIDDAVVKLSKFAEEEFKNLTLVDYGRMVAFQQKLDDLDRDEIDKEVDRFL
jgi:hypothetical protein